MTVNEDLWFFNENQDRYNFDSTTSSLPDPLKDILNELTRRRNITILGVHKDYYNIQYKESFIVTFLYREIKMHTRVCLDIYESSGPPLEVIVNDMVEDIYNLICGEVAKDLEIDQL